MGGMHFLGLILVWTLVAVEGQSQQISYQGENQVSDGNPNPPPTPQTIPQTQQAAERRLSLEDFFMNRPQQQQPQAGAPQQPIQQLPLPQFQVQQSDPNSVMLVRDTQFPSQNGGLVSRLVMLRRMMRLRRWARRLSFIPRLVRLGARSTSLRQAASEPQPVILANNRVGRTYNDEPYDPRDYVLGNKGFSYNNTPSSQDNYNSRDQPKQDANTNSREVDSYYDTVNDLPYDLYDNKNTNGYGTDDSNFDYQNKYRDMTNSNNNGDRQLQSYDVAKNLQQKLMKNMQQQYSNYPQRNPNPSFGSQQNEIVNSNIYPKNTQQDSYKQDKQVYQNTNHQDSLGNNYGQNQKSQENSNHYDKSPENNAYQEQREQQLQKLHEQQLQLLREQQLLKLLREQQILLERQRQLQQQGGNLHQQQNQQPQIELQIQGGNLYQQQNQNQQPQIELQQQGGNLYQQQNQNQQSQIELQQQGGNLYQQQNQNQQPQIELQQQGGNLYQQQNQNQPSQIESESPVSNYPAQTYSQPQQNSHEKTEKNGYEKPFISGTNNVGSATRIGSGGNNIGVGVNVGIKPPGVDFSFANPVSSVIKPLQPVFNPIIPKPIPAPAVAEQLVPLGFLPKPMLNLNGRLFFGAEVGKGVKVGR